MDNEELFFLPLRQLKQCFDLYDLESVLHEYVIVGMIHESSIFTVMNRERLQKQEIVERAETTPTTTNSRRS